MNSNQNSLFIPDQYLLELRMEHGDCQESLDLLRLGNLIGAGLDEPWDGQKEFYSSGREALRWQVLKQPSYHRARLEYLGRLDSPGQRRRLLCITQLAGIGKTVALDQLVALRSAIPGHFVVRVHLRELPTRWEEYLDQAHKPHQEVPFLVAHVMGRIMALPEERRARVVSSDIIESWRANSQNASDWVRQWLRCKIRMGQFTLAVDGLDEVASQDQQEEIVNGTKRLIDKGSVPKAKALRTFLDHHDRVHCAVAGRPYAITEVLWSRLFATRMNASHDATSPWEFCLTGMFTDGQRRRFLGKERYDLLQTLQGGIEFSARTLEVLRTLRVDVFETLRSKADAYWHSIDQSISLDRHPEGEKPVIPLEKPEILDLLSALAITTVLWNDDPLFPKPSSPVSKQGTAVAPIRRRFFAGLVSQYHYFCRRFLQLMSSFLAKSRTADGRLPEDRSTSPPEDHGDLPISITDLHEFRRRTFDRLARIYSSWRDNDYQIANQKYKQLRQLSTQHIEFNFFKSEDPKEIAWSQSEQRDFFAALWMVRSSCEKERSWLNGHQSSERKGDGHQLSRHLSLVHVWRFLCGMPDRALEMRPDVNSKEDRWLACIAALFQRPQKAEHRPTELMYGCWPNLLRRAEFLKRADWSEDDLQLATAAAQQAADPKRTKSTTPTEQSRANQARQIVLKFLGEYPALRDGHGQSARICREDLEEHWCDCNSHNELYFLCGHRDEVDNSERIVKLERPFQLCAYQVTNRLYALFDPTFPVNEKEYCNHSPYLRGAAIYKNWYDATMAAMWFHGRLPTEWEWEYASRGKYKLCNRKSYFDEKRNRHIVAAWVYPLDLQPLFFWGPDIDVAPAHAWIVSNSSIRQRELCFNQVFPSEPHAHVVGKDGHHNDFQLYDMSGNVWEWTASLFESGAVSRSVRGAAFNMNATYVRCSFRHQFSPFIAKNTTGFRVARTRFK